MDIKKQIQDLRWLSDQLRNDKELDCSIKQLADEWIKFADLKPEQCPRYEGKHIIDILVTTHNGRVTKVQYKQWQNNKGEYENRWYCGRIHGELVAWMPLPEPYKK